LVVVGPPYGHPPLATSPPMGSGRSWSRCCPRPGDMGGRIMITAGSSTASCSSSTPASPGATCRSATVPGRPSTAGCGAGPRAGAGSSSSVSCRRAWAEEDRIAWTMRWGAPVRRRDQGPSGDRRPGPPAGAAPDRRSAPGVRGARAGARGGPHPAPAGAAAPAPRGARRGQGVHLSAAPALAPRGTCGRSFPSGAISRTRGAIGPADAPPSIESPIATRYKKLAIQYLAMLYVGLSEKYLTTLFAGTA
jgi:hypothetical protein